MPTQAPPDSDLGFPAKGSLKRVPFAFLVRDIARMRATGNLYLLAGETKKVVFFVDGRPTLVRSNLPTEFLGQILTDQGLITQEQCDNTLEAIRRTGKKQGELLVEMGILSEGNLRYGLEEQVRIKLFEIFAWEEGRFQFKQSGEPGAPNLGFTVEMPTEALIVAGVQERWSDERARAALKVLAERYPAALPPYNNDPSLLELLPEEQHFLRCLDGSRTVDELLSRKYDPEVPQVSTLLFGLIASGVVEAGETRQARKLPPPRPNLAPPMIAEDKLIPKFEQLSAITEYEDTPLPNKLPGGAAISSSRNRLVPVLPTEDEEMFRGLDIDESIVVDTRGMLRTTSEVLKSVPLAPEPRPLDDESDFVDLGADDDETDFSELVHTHIPGRGPAPVPASQPQDDPNRSVLPQPPPRGDSSKSPLPQASADSGKSPLPARADSGKSPSPARTDASTPASSEPGEPMATRVEAGYTPPEAGASDSPAPDTVRPTPATPRLGGAPPASDLRMRLSARTPTLNPIAAPTPAPVAAEPPGDLGRDPGGDLGGDLGDEPDLGDLGDLDDLPDLGDLDDDLDVLDDEALFDDDPLGDDPLGDDPLGDEPASFDEPLAGDSLAGDALAADAGEPRPFAALEPRFDGEADGEDADLLGDSALIDASAVLPATDLGDPSGVTGLPDLDDDSLPDEPLEGEDEELGDLAEDLELEDVELEADDDLEADLGEGFGEDEPLEEGFTSSNEDTDGGYRVEGGAQSAEMLGATRYGQAEDAMREGDYDQAVALFEDAYANGYDVAELHAHLAFARYRASNNDPTAGTHALELLDWAEQADPGLPMIHAYRGAIFVGLGRQEEADECFDRALYLDPENELALAYTRGE